MDPVEQIIEQLQGMLRKGDLKPGKKIPSERILAEQFQTTRGYVRKALQKLELYGVLKIVPQKGIYVSSIRTIALDTLMSNIMSFTSFNMRDLIETRSNLEVFATELAAKRGEREDLEKVAQAHARFQEACEDERSTLEEDHLFHLEIVRASKNTVLLSLLTLITPEIIAMNRDYKEDHMIASRKSLTEHQEILDGLQSRDVEAAVDAMSRHMERSRIRRLPETAR